MNFLGSLIQPVANIAGGIIKNRGELCASKTRTKDEGVGEHQRLGK